MITMTSAFTLQNIEIQELFAAHTPQSNYLPKLSQHYYCDFLSIAELQKSPDNKVDTFGHVHDAYEFLIPLDPTPLIVQNDAIYFGEVGYVYPVMGGRPHGVQVEYKNIANYNVTVAKSFMEQRLAEKGLAGGEFNSRFEVSNGLNTAIKWFITEFEKGASTDRIDLNQIGSLIISCFIESGCRPILQDRRKPQQQYQRGMKSVISFINQHFTECITIDQLAEISGFTRNYFINAFKKMTGEAPYTHIKLLRVSKAKVLLENTELPISDIAIECGFEKANSFSSLFKKETGMVPTDYRRKMRDLNEKTV